MKTIPCRLTPLLALALSATIGWGAYAAQPSANANQGDLQAAIQARTEVTEMQIEVQNLDTDIRTLMRKAVAKADAKQTEGNILLAKDRYDDAVAAFKEAARLYRQVADGKKLLDRVGKAERGAATARMLAESTAKPEQLKDARRMEINAEGYFQAGEFGPAIAELDKARQAYENCCSPRVRPRWNKRLPPAPR
jgi:tetratricopeptide (TPR) repeat protein